MSADCGNCDCNGCDSCSPDCNSGAGNSADNHHDSIFSKICCFFVCRDNTGIESIGSGLSSAPVGVGMQKEDNNKNDKTKLLNKESEAYFKVKL